MNILQVIPFFSPEFGGSTVRTFELSKELSKRDHNVTIITTDFKLDKKYKKSIEDFGVEIVPFHCVANIGLFLFSPSMKKWLKREITNYDVVHMHNFRSYQNNLVCTYAKKYGIPYIIQARGTLPRIIEKKFLKYLYDWIWGYKILRDASKVFALTQFEVDQYTSMNVNKDKIERVPNGIDLSEYVKLPRRGEFRKKYLIRDDEKLVLYLGRIHKIKGIDLLVNAFADLTKEIGKVRLVIIGPDEGVLSTLKRQIGDLKIGDKILLTGPLYEREKLKAYVDADVYVLPSVYEAFPNTVLEAYACGTPAIVTNRCSIADLIEKIGYVVEYDKEQLKNAILKIICDDELRINLGNKGREFVRENLDWKKIVLEIEKIYLNMMEQK